MTPARRRAVAHLEAGGVLATHQRHQRVVLLTAHRAAIQIGPQTGDRSVGVAAGQFELDERVQPVEALIATDLAVARPA